ncbi:nuclear transport factor 2 family protein [Galactobacter caseinivorans]|uniref:Nuclear transport factor 2 family protein n=1 Tax=Galactobacter caseinivorans TaxID=2676123 RepID=A0A496PLX9_9MICC|nr:nuclear transport factor 2 family protein [Galactobacter caseinivorans]RKW71551.1 nuclear transport factor 2 family protein [Galactobacter caseinivorans]
MIEKTPASVAATYFDALSRGDVPTVMNQFDQEVLWHQPGTNRFSGDYRGVEAIGALISGMMEVSDGTFALAATGSYMVNGELVAVPVRFTGKRATGALDLAGVDLLTVRGGKIVAAHLFSEDASAEDAFWGQF